MLKPRIEEIKIEKKQKRIYEMLKEDFDCCSCNCLICRKIKNILNQDE